MSRESSGSVGVVIKVCQCYQATSAKIVEKGEIFFVVVLCSKIFANNKTAEQISCNLLSLGEI